MGVTIFFISIPFERDEAIIGKRIYGSEYGFATRSVHTGNDIDAETGAIRRPIELGADFCVESLTKYINGHGDAMGGAIIGKKEYLDEIRSQAQVNLGATISPFNAWLIMRGSVTLPLMTS